MKLDQLVDRARHVSVRQDVADAYVRELDRWATRERPSRAWIPWLAAGLAMAAAIALVIARVASAPTATAPTQIAPIQITPVQIGDRVAIIAAPGTSYRVVAVSAGETRVAVDSGAVTARLFHGATPHHLALEGGGVIATATGTVFSVSVTASGGAVHVDEGTVEVVDRTGVHAVATGTSFPTTSPAPDPRPAATLIALAPPSPAPPLDAGVAAPDVGVAAPPPPPPTQHPAHPAASVEASTTTTKEQWRLVRLLRGQGKFAEAIAACIVIADAHDPTWSPIALVEAVRIYLGPLTDPEHAITIADRMMREWPDHALAGETRSLRCQALAQLGRAADCTR